MRQISEFRVPGGTFISKDPALGRRFIYSTVQRDRIFRRGAVGIKGELNRSTCGRRCCVIIIHPCFADVYFDFFGCINNGFAIRNRICCGCSETCGHSFSDPVRDRIAGCCIDPRQLNERSGPGGAFIALYAGTGGGVIHSSVQCDRITCGGQFSVTDLLIQCKDSRCRSCQRGIIRISPGLLCRDADQFCVGKGFLDILKLINRMLLRSTGNCRSVYRDRYGDHACCGFIRIIRRIRGRDLYQDRIRVINNAVLREYTGSFLLLGRRIISDTITVYRAGGDHFFDQIIKFSGFANRNFTVRVFYRVEIDKSRSSVCERSLDQGTLD